MNFDQNEKHIPLNDMLKSHTLTSYDVMEDKQNRQCKGKCVQFKAIKPVTGGRYEAGQYRCQTCEIYLSEQGIDGGFCRCCNFRVRSRPRNSFYKEKYHENKIRNIDEPRSQPELIEDSEEVVIPKKSTPIYEEIDESVKTFYEFKEFLESKMKPQENYQLVMLKELLEYGRLHKGEIAESLAYFNNKDSSDINSVKNFFHVPVYGVLVKHGFVKEDNSDYLNLPHYSLNVKLEGFQKIELIEYLNNALAKYNIEHNIPENQYPNANNMGSINWSYPLVKSITNDQTGILSGLKIPNIDKETPKTHSHFSWIWSVTPENWKILKVENVWGSRIPKEKISQIVKPGDRVAFYVIGSNSFKGVYEFVGEWYDSPGVTWVDDMEANGELRYKSQIKIKPVCLGTALLSKLHEKMELFKDKPNNIRNLILQGGGGYPSNNQKSLSVDDFNIIISQLEKNPETYDVNFKPQEETKETNDPLDVIECPKCHVIIDKKETVDSSYFYKLIEEKFGYQASDKNDGTTKVPQIYCKICRSENVSSSSKQSDNKIESQNKSHFKIFDDNGDSVKIKNCQIESTDVIKKGQHLTNDEIVAKFGVGNMGGIRYSSKNNVIVLCDTQSGHYNDQFDKDFQMVYYTGEGQKGNQTITGGNQRIVNSENTPMFYFVEVRQEPGERKRGALDNIYKFVGRVKYARHALKTENDIDGLSRQVIKFLLEVQN